MALIIDISINDKHIKGIYAVRVSGGTNPDDMNRYEVFDCSNRSDSPYPFLGDTTHRYGDGAVELAKKILELVEKE